MGHKDFDKAVERRAIRILKDLEEVGVRELDIYYDGELYNIIKTVMGNVTLYYNSAGKFFRVLSRLDVDRVKGIVRNLRMILETSNRVAYIDGTKDGKFNLIMNKAIEMVEIATYRDTLVKLHKDVLFLNLRYLEAIEMLISMYMMKELIE